MKKIRALVLKAQYDALKEELKRFNVSLYKLGNKLIFIYKDKKIPIQSLKNKETAVIQFNANKNLDENNYLDILKKQNIQVEADYIRGIIAKYLNEPVEVREYILFNDVIKTLKKAIELRKKVAIKQQKKYTVINPYFLKRSIKDGLTYLFFYCESTQNFQFYKISDLKQINILNQDIELKETSYIEKIKKDKDVI